MSNLLNLQQIASCIKSCRKVSGMTQARLAAESGVSRSTIIGIEKCTIKEIGFYRLRNVLDVAMKARDLACAQATSHNYSFSHKKSDEIGLSVPYDWSNPNISDNALILNVLQRGIFLDVCQIVLHYGFDRVNSLVCDLPYDDIGSAAINRMMKNIKRSIDNANKN